MRHGVLSISWVGNFMSRACSIACAPNFDKRVARWVKDRCFPNCQFSLSWHYIFSYWVTVSQATEDSCNLMFWIKGNDEISRQRRRKPVPQNFSKYRLTKKLWKFRLRRKIRIGGSEMQIMSGAIIRGLPRSLFSLSLSSMRKQSFHPGNGIKLSGDIADTILLAKKRIRGVSLVSHGISSAYMNSHFNVRGNKI